jgi:transcriptional regulator with XRE-family HTH domain
LEFDKNEVYDFNKFINEELELRKLRNANYSLRAFARDLGVGASTLSSTLRNDINPSLKLIADILEKLNTSPEIATKILLWERCSKCLRVLDELRSEEKVRLAIGENQSFNRTVDINSELSVFMELLFKINDNICRSLEEISSTGLNKISYKIIFEKN